jgi:hypothetical protein
MEGGSFDKLIKKEKINTLEEIHNLSLNKSIDANID